MANITVVRNQAYKRSGINLRERHNERKNECYRNADIRLDRSHLNVPFRRCEGSYTEAFDKLCSNGIISTRGLKADAKIIDEMVFDVNFLYFEENGTGKPDGGYEFTKRFYAEACQLAVKEAGDERYILSAVMHADELNQAVSAELGKDVYHYHLHVVYIPSVEKEIKWSKRCKNPALIGKTKEVIHPVSYSQKWPKGKNANGEWVNSYSLLQDRFFEHMQGAGFWNFERGDIHSTRQHLTDMEYKIQKDTERLEQAVKEKEVNCKDLDVTIKNKENRIVTLNQRLSARKKGIDDFIFLDHIGKKNLLGQTVLTLKELKTVKSLAEEGAGARGRIYDLENMVMCANREADLAKRQRKAWKRKYEELLSETKLYLEAIALIPQKVKTFLTKALEEYKSEHQTRQRVHKEKDRKMYK